MGTNAEPSKKGTADDSSDLRCMMQWIDDNLKKTWKMVSSSNNNKWIMVFKSCLIEYLLWN